MKPLEIERLVVLNAETGRRQLSLKIDGHVAELVRPYSTPEGLVAVEIEDSVLQHILVVYPLRVLQTQFWSVGFVGGFIGDDLFRAATIAFWGDFLDLRPEVRRETETKALEPPTFHFSFAIEVADWASPWTPREYSRALERVAGTKGVPSLVLETLDVPEEGFTFSCEARSLDNKLGDEIGYWSGLIRSIHEEATAQLIAELHADSLTTSFQFPPAIATACEQYLLYFVQFLADLGIQADAEVQHKAAEVLFRVTPAEGPEALERIREALDAYLSLPTDPSFAVVAAQEHDLAIRQLEANVFHLQGQLSIAKAVLQAKDAQIEAMELSNFRLRQISGGEIQDRGQESGLKAGQEDTESIIPGVVSVKQVEKGGLVLHTPELLRKLKRRFGW